jgi:hypothetical protein
VGEWRSDDAKENRVAMAASIQALRGKRVFTGTPNVKLIDLPQLCLDRITEVEGTRS